MLVAGNGLAVENSLSVIGDMHTYNALFVRDFIMD